MFRSSTIVRELVLGLAKVMFKHLCPYRLCGGVAACRGSGVCCVLCRMRLSGLCVVQNGTEWRVCCVLCRMRLSRRPKHVGAMFM
jgi:hypothetical protein